MFWLSMRKIFISHCSFIWFWSAFRFLTDQDFSLTKWSLWQLCCMLDFICCIVFPVFRCLSYRLCCLCMWPMVTNHWFVTTYSYNHLYVIILIIYHLFKHILFISYKWILGIVVSVIKVISFLIESYGGKIINFIHTFMTSFDDHLFHKPSN